MNAFCLSLLLAVTGPYTSPTGCTLPPATDALSCIFTKQDPSYIDAISADAKVTYVGIEDGVVVDQRVINGRVFRKILADQIKATDEKNQPWQLILGDETFSREDYTYEFILLNTVTEEMTYYAVKTGYNANANISYPHDLITEVLVSEDPVYVEKALKRFKWRKGYAGR